MSPKSELWNLATLLNSGERFGQEGKSPAPLTLFPSSISDIDVKRSLDSFADLWKRYPLENVIFTFNGGKDSVTAFFLLLESLIVYLRERGEVVGTESLSRCIERIKFVQFRPRKNYTFPQLEKFVVDMFDVFPTAKLQVLNMDYKEGMGHLVDNGIEVAIMGTRGTDPDGVSLDSILADSSEGWPKFKRFCPLLFWSYEKVWRFLLDNKLPYCELYDRGYTSIGSKISTGKNPFLLKEDGTYYSAHTLTDGSKERAGRCISRRNSDADEN